MANVLPSRLREAALNRALTPRDMALIIDKINELSPQAGHIIEDEGAPLAQRSSLNFEGAGVTAADSAGKTVVTIPGGGGGGGSITNIFRARLSINQALTGSSTPDTIIFDTVDIAYAGYNNSTGIYTVQSGEDGTYQFGTDIAFIPPTDNIIQVLLVVNGSALVGGFNTRFPTASGTFIMNAQTGPVELSAGDTVQVLVVWSGVSTPDVQSANDTTRFWGMRIA